MLLGGDPPDVLDAVFAFVVAAVCALLLVPFADRLARRIGAIDIPSERSLHERPTPRLGGLAILVGVVAAGVLFLPWNPQPRAILAGAIAITAVGILDDIRDLGAGPKLLGQVAATTIPVAAGVKVANFTLPFFGRVEIGSIELFELPVVGEVDLGFVATLLGIVAVINVINLIDGVDGLAAGVCVISAVTLATIALSLDRFGAGVLAALTAGAALGFLRHGFPPASTFMGDTGSNLLGYLLGVVSVVGAVKTNAVVALFFPLLVLTLPILDSSFVIAKRLKYRRPIYVGDQSHFHHRFANIGFSQRRTLAYLYGWALVMAGFALALRFVPYSDDHGNFDPGWTAVMLGCGAAALAASLFVVLELEILKLRLERFRGLLGRRRAVGGPPPTAGEVDEGVAHEIETGSFAAVNPETGEVETVDPETGEFETIGPPGR